MIYVVGIFIGYVLHVLYRLNWIITVVLLCFMEFMTFLYHKRYYQAKEKEKSFLEVSLYLDTVLYSFLKEEKVDLAIRDVSLTLSDGKMKSLAQQVFEYMNMSFEEVEVLKEALHKIEKEYPCQRIIDVHQFMIHVEEYGGEIEKSVNLLLEDKNRWEQRVKRTIAERNKQILDVILSVMASFFICAAMMHLPLGMMDISEEWMVQIGAFLAIICNLGIVYHALNYVNIDWIQLQLSEEDAYYVQKMVQFKEYEEKKEKKLSYILGGVGCIVTAAVFIMQKEWLTVIFMGLTIVFFEQHKVGRKLQQKYLTREIKYAFPKWLLDIVLLLQSEMYMWHYRNPTSMYQVYCEKNYFF